MNVKKLICLALSLTLLLSMTACKSRKKTSDNPVQTLPPIETAVQKEYTTEEILDMYNSALDKIKNSTGYHMSGSTNSTSVFGGVMSSSINIYDVKYQVVDGKGIAFFDSKLSADGDDFTHTTYFDGEHYYYSYSDLMYYKNTNDYQDFIATDWLMPIGDVELQNVDSMDQLDGSVDISFTLPMGDFMSYAVLDLVGFNSETFEQDPVHLSFNIDSEGNLTYFYISYTSNQIFLDQETEQTIVASLSIGEYDNVTVEAPTNLSVYENFIEETVGDEHEGVGILSPEDVD